MFLGTLDGLAAVHYKKGSDLGELINRVTPELCDVMFLVALTVARPEWMIAGIAALAFAWLTSFSGLLGAVIHKPTQSVGPVGPTDRLVALQILSLFAFLSDVYHWNVDFILLFLLWCSIGGSLTIALRLSRNFRNANVSTTESVKG